MLQCSTVAGTTYGCHCCCSLNLGMLLCALAGGESQSDSQAERAKQSGSGGNFDGDSNVVLAFHTGGLLAVRKSKEHVSVYACS